MCNGTPALAEGEIHVATIQVAGHAPYNLILLPGEIENATHQEATEWAASIGGELPNRYEQALLYAHHRNEFERGWHWSCEQHESDPDCVWCQDFSYGCQTNGHRSSKLRARAVRRDYIDVQQSQQRGEDG